MCIKSFFSRITVGLLHHRITDLPEKTSSSASATWKITVTPMWMKKNKFEMVLSNLHERGMSLLHLIHNTLDTQGKNEVMHADYITFKKDHVPYE